MSDTSPSPSTTQANSHPQLIDVPIEQLKHAAKALHKANNIVVFSGAGISAESGIATFRAPDVGWWANKIGLVLFGTPFGWNWLSRFAWSAYRIFRKPISEAQPNPGHYAIAELEQYAKSNGKNFTLITQNVDALHQRAGSSHVLELHGTVYKHRCISKGHYADPELTDDDIFNTKPRCKQCGSFMRPDAVLFTEGLPVNTFLEAEMAIRQFDSFMGTSVMIIVGTSGVVYPAASLPEFAAQMPNTLLIDVNPEPSTYQQRGLVDISLQAASGAVLPEIMRMIRDKDF